ncbi:MAG: hypothetical protein ACR2NL_10600, partial [Acidimicrobiia bacterium]
VQGDGPPIGHADMVLLYDQAISLLTSTIGQAYSVGLADWAARAQALRAISYHRRAVWVAVNAMTPGSAAPLISDANAFADALTVTALPQVDVDWTWSYSASVPNLLGNWFATPQLNLNANYAGLVDPVDGGPPPEVSRVLTELSALGLTSLIVTSMRDAHLILAEAALAVGDLGGFTTHLNDLRGLDALSPYPATPNVTTGVERLKYERAANLFLRGTRLSDNHRFADWPAAWPPESESGADPGTLIPIASVAANAVATIAVSDFPTGDRFEAQYESFWEPGVVLVSGELDTGDCRTDEVFTVIGVAMLDFMEAPCPGSNRVVETAYFSDQTATSLRAAGWSAGLDVVDEKALAPPLTIPVAITIALHPATYDAIVVDEPLIETVDQAKAFVQTQVEEELSLARTRFIASPTGIDFAQEVGGFALLDDVAEISALTGPASANSIPEMCEDLTSLLSGSSLLTQGVINVYYLDDVPAAPNGAFCRFTPDMAETILVVDWEHRHSSTLAHEFGHAMGLYVPHNGHVGPYSIQGLAADNFMHVVESGTTRSTFSLGQAFRMSADPTSWLNHSTELGSGVPTRGATELKVRCPCDPYTTDICPNVAFPVDDGAGINVGTRCSDALRLHPPDGSDQDLNNTVAIISGRTWREEACQRHEIAYEIDSSAHFADVRFTNYANSLGCEPRFAAFLEGFAMFVIEDAGLWTYRVEIADADVGPRVKIPVRLWRPTGSNDSAQRDGVSRVFHCGETTCAASDPWPQRTGFETDWNDGVADLSVSEIGDLQNCSLPAASALSEINVYQLDGPGPAWVQTDQGFSCYDPLTDAAAIVVPFGSSPTTLAHHLGHLLGISDAITGDGLAAGNLMQTTGDLDQRVELTLGQVFRLNMHDQSWLVQKGLGPAPPIDCDDPTVPLAGDRVCPPIDLNP